MAKSLSELKRNAMEKKIEMRLSPVGMWSDGLPERLQGWRKAISANSNSITLLNGEGRESKLYIDCASLIEYDNNRLTVYAAGLRELTDNEKKIINEWSAVQKERAEKYPYSDDYWAKKSFFEQRKAEHLLGYEYIRGCKYDYNTGKVYDKKIKGNVQLQYEIRVAQ